MQKKKIDLLICCGGGCTLAGSLKIRDKFIEVLTNKKILDDINIVKTGCMGPCDFAPIVMVYPDGTFYKKVQIEDIEEIVTSHLINGVPLERLMCQENGLPIKEKNNIPFYKSQVKVALEHCGFINPESIDQYIELGGYVAFSDVLKIEPQKVVEICIQSGLRGRGGAGFPTGLKWDFVRKAINETKYLICNADEGDPGAFMDRSLLEGDPHRILEGMLIAAYATGCTKGFLYIRKEYPDAIAKVKQAIENAEMKGLIGKNILGSSFSFDFEIRTGAGAFVCGEETALISSIEGKRGQPTSKPPYPANKGLWEKPSLVNNVETFANIPAIYRKGPEWFSQMGTVKSKGTKVFALTGDVVNTGLVEVPMGITLREMIYVVGGGIAGGHDFKAVQLGGPSGGCLTKQHLEVQIDYESLTERGAMMGSGGVIVMNDTNCMVNIAKFFLDFSCDESCGKCAPCRIGLKQMLDILEKITKGEGKEGDIEELETIGRFVKQTSLCGLGQTAPNPVLSTIRYFRDEYQAHIEKKACPTMVCIDLFNFSINKDLCIGCSLCARRCPPACIHGSKQDKYTIEQVKCVKCGSCVNVCPVKAISKNVGMHDDVYKEKYQSDDSDDFNN